MQEFDINGRIKYLRTEILKLTQQEFAQKINMSRGNLAKIDVNQINVTNRVISDICREFSLNEEWLRTGIGGDDNIFFKVDLDFDSAIGELYADGNEFKKTAIQILLNEMSDEEWGVILKFANAFSEYKKKTQSE